MRGSAIIDTWIHVKAINKGCIDVQSSKSRMIPSFPIILLLLRERKSTAESGHGHSTRFSRAQRVPSADILWPRENQRPYQYYMVISA